MTTIRRRTACKGMSIAEMTVVLALISIVSLLVVSFTTMVNLRNATAVTKNRVADDIHLSKIVLENWVETVTGTYNAPVSVAEDGKSLWATIEGARYGATLSDGFLVATLPGGEDLQCPVGEITTVTFAQMHRVDGQIRTDSLWFCTAQYALRRSDGSLAAREIVFCINPHVGDVVGEAGGVV